MPKRKVKNGEILAGALMGALFLWIFILILFVLLDVSLVDVFNVVEGDTPGQTTFFNFLILYALTVLLGYFAGNKVK